jgi:hypothetical protein
LIVAYRCPRCLKCLFPGLAKQEEEEEKDDDDDQKDDIDDI